ncbi:MAG TPA: hypothetical protein VGM50_05020 [Gemmatimonadaceae bacterium]
MERGWRATRLYQRAYMRDVLAKPPPHSVNKQFEKIYFPKRKEIKAFYDAGVGNLMTGASHDATTAIE